jgi:predicted acyl esterase
VTSGVPSARLLVKGIGQPPRLGKVDDADQTGAWRTTTSWPPANTRQQVLHLSAQALTRDPAVGVRTFRSAPNLFNSWLGPQTVGFPYQPWSALCALPGVSASGTEGLVYATAPLDAPAVIAGDPVVHLQVSSDQPGGHVTANLVVLESDFACDQFGQPSGLRMVSRGAADLRFHTGGFEAVPFPTNTVTPVRIDLYHLAERVEAGERLALVLSTARPTTTTSTSRSTRTPAAHGGNGPDTSHIVVPLVDGTLDGRRAPTDVR